MPMKVGLGIVSILVIGIRPGLPEQEFLIRRKVCSGELEFFEAREIIRTVYIQIMDAMSVINETMLK